MNGENIFKQRYTKIIGLSAIRRLPRLGKIRLGVKVEYGEVVPTTKNGKNKWEKKTRPKEVDYFVCPLEIRKVYGEKPKELKISFPMNDPEVIFPQCYKWYGSSMGLKCRGDGETALRLNEETKEMEERECPCELLEEGKCKQRASLIFMMPGIKISGVYQIDLSSYHSIVDINSGIDYARVLLNDQIAFVPFKLKRVPKETHNKGMKQIHYTLQLELDITEDDLAKLQKGKRLFWGQNRQYEIEPPEEDINPAFDSKEKGAVIEPETEKEKIEREKRESEVQEKLKKEYQESKEREIKLEKEKEEGKHKIKSFKESKTIYKKKKEEGEKIEAELDPKDIEEVKKLLWEVGIDNWNQVLYYARRANLKVDTVAELKKLLVEDKEKISIIFDAKEAENKPAKVGTLEKYWEKENKLIKQKQEMEDDIVDKESLEDYEISSE